MPSMFILGESIYFCSTAIAYFMFCLCFCFNYIYLASYKYLYQCLSLVANSRMPHLTIFSLAPWNCGGHTKTSVFSQFPCMNTAFFLCRPSLIKNTLNILNPTVAKHCSITHKLLRKKLLLAQLPSGITTNRAARCASSPSPPDVVLTAAATFCSSLPLLHHPGLICPPLENQAFCSCFRVVIPHHRVGKRW